MAAVQVSADEVCATILGAHDQLVDMKQPPSFFVKFDCVVESPGGGKATDVEEELEHAKAALQRAEIKLTKAQALVGAYTALKRRKKVDAKGEDEQDFEESACDWLDRVRAFEDENDGDEAPRRAAVRELAKEEMAQDEFDQIDLDGDGILSREEFRKKYGNQKGDIEFNRIDANGDGSVSRPEWNKAVDQAVAKNRAIQVAALEAQRKVDLAEALEAVQKEVTAIEGWRTAIHRSAQSFKTAASPGSVRLTWWLRVDPLAQGANWAGVTEAQLAAFKAELVVAIPRLKPTAEQCSQEFGCLNDLRAEGREVLEQTRVRLEECGHHQKPNEIIAMIAAYKLQGMRDHELYRIPSSLCV